MPTPLVEPAGVAVVLGGSEGIGAAIVRRLAAAGHQVVAVARTAEVLAATCLDIDPTGRTVVPLAADLTARDAADLVCRRATEAFGATPSIIVQSASMFRAGPLSAVDDDELSEMFQANVAAPFRTIRRLVAGITTERGHVVIINSSAGIRLNPESAAYSASQIAVRALTDGLRFDVNDRGVRVTSIFPGRTDTRLHREVLEYEQSEFDPQYVLHPGDVAEAMMAALLASPLAEITELVIRPLLRKQAG